MKKVCVIVIVFCLFGLTFYFGQAGIQVRKEKGGQPPIMAAPNNHEGEPKIKIS